MQFSNADRGGADREEVLKLLNYLMDSSTAESYFEKVDRFRRVDRQSLIEELYSLLEHPDNNIRSRTSEVLLQIDALLSLERVLPLLKDPDEYIRLNICHLLCGYGDQRAVEALVDVLLDDSDSDVRFHAAMALGKIGDARAIPALELAAKHDFASDFQGATVSSAASAALAAIRNTVHPS